MDVILFTLLGLIAGSFINAVVWRLRSGESIMFGRSMCPNCKHQLGPVDLVPVLSWLVQKGRCRYCKKSYGIHYLVVELGTAILFGVSAWLLQSIGIVSFLVWIGILVLLIILALYDAQWYELQNKIMHPALVLAVIYFVLGFEGSESLIQLLAALAAGVVFYAAWWLSHGQLIGGADSKLVLLMGLVLPPQQLLVAIALGFMLGGVGAAVLLYTKHKGLQDQMPFGPYLIAGLIIAQLWGANIIAILGF